MVAAKLSNMTVGQPQKNSAILQDTSRASAADMLNVSERGVNTAKKVEGEGAADLIGAVEGGEVPVSAPVLDEMRASVRKLRRHVLVLMQHPHNQDSVVGDYINDQMLFIMVNADRRAKIAPLGGHFWRRDQYLEFFVQPLQISSSLIPAPSILGVSGDTANVGICGHTDRENGHYWLSISCCNAFMLKPSATPLPKPSVIAFCKAWCLVSRSSSDRSPALTTSLAVPNRPDSTCASMKPVK